MAGSSPGAAWEWRKEKREKNATASLQLVTGAVHGLGQLSNFLSRRPNKERAIFFAAVMKE
jgi:hypothetical protein